MTTGVDETHDPALRSWVESANAPGDFPIQNLPLGIFRRRDSAEEPRAGAAIGDRILDLGAARRAGLLTGEAAEAGEACLEPALNRLMSLGSGPRRALRHRLSALLRAGNAGKGEAANRKKVEPLLLPMAEAEMLLPAQVGDYTDFYASIHHAENVGRLFRPDQPLLPNYKHVPIAYHGRASSLVPSGTPFRRPQGQRRDGEGEPEFGPSRALDYEVEMGFFVGPGNDLGRPIPLREAEEHLFGLCLVNDWSARDIQKWEYQPLGPFLGKNFATTVSPWVVTLEALAPFRTGPRPHGAGDPRPLPYLDDPENARRGAFDIVVEAGLATDGSPAGAPAWISRAELRDLYWTPAQMLAHHAVNGCNLRSGDLLASGTVSGSARTARGCLLELTSGGKEPLALPGGQTRRFLEDGDTVILRASCQAEGFISIGFGPCQGKVLPALRF